MNPILKNILAVIAGWFLGSVVNLGLVNIGHSVFPMENVNTQDMEALGEFLKTASMEFFVFPFLAHAIGTLVGALVAAFIATANHKMNMALVVGGVFFIGGIAASLMISAPFWFTVTDLLLAYFPMALLGAKIASKFTKA
jgi:hypothetical protein